ncbi:MAG: FliI/YscN family ATPase [bacterium]
MTPKGAIPRLRSALGVALTQVSSVEPSRLAGRITQVVGTIAEASGLPLPLGSRVVVVDQGREWELEVIGFKGRTTVLMPYDTLAGLRPGLLAMPLPSHSDLPSGEGLLGRVIDSRGMPLDDKGPLLGVTRKAQKLATINPVTRARIDTPLATGVRAIDGLLALGKGQKIGIFAGSGVGKSVLLGMIARQTAADVNVIALIGERGKEVREFIENDLGPAGLARSVVIVVTSDESPLKRLRAANLATAIAAGFRESGKQVLLMMDSLTRVAHAQRELGLAVGEPPTSRGYPPSVFTLLPQILEQVGSVGAGSITGIYTVLVEGDDFNEPVADLARSILEGHLVLSRTLASSGHYPAIDVLESLSRCFTQIVPGDQQGWASELRGVLAAYCEVRDLVQIGAYRAGTNAETDRVIARLPAIQSFLRQAVDEAATWDGTRKLLQQAAAQPPATSTVRPLGPAQLPGRKAG